MILEKINAVGLYLVARLQEPSTYRGLILIVSAGAWHKLDQASQGEVIMQSGVILAGLVQALVPQSVLYRPSK